jgi:hypothetical protein
MKNMLSEALREIRGLLNQLLTNLEGEQGSEWLAEFKKFLRKENCWTSVVGDNSLLKLISGGETLTVDAYDGTEILADAKDVFNYIDSDFRNWKADEAGKATDETPVNVYEMVKDGTYAELFSSLNSDVEKLFFTQAQIKGFVKKHRKWLRKDGYGTFFPFKSNGKRFVAFVYVFSDDRLSVLVRMFEGDGVWRAEGRPRIVVPQLAVTQ